MMGISMEANSAALASDRRAVATYLREFADASQSRHESTNLVCQQLRTSVEAYVACLRDGGALPEQVLIQIKSAVWEALPQYLYARKTRAVMNDVVRWSIEAYYLTT